MFPPLAYTKETQFRQLYSLPLAGEEGRKEGRKTENLDCRQRRECGGGRFLGREREKKKDEDDEMR